jgi:hypothetical protein
MTVVIVVMVVVMIAHGFLRMSCRHYRHGARQVTYTKLRPAGRPYFSHVQFLCTCIKFRRINVLILFTFFCKSRHRFR